MQVFMGGGLSKSKGLGLVCFEVPLSPAECRVNRHNTNLKNLEWIKGGVNRGFTPCCFHHLLVQGTAVSCHKVIQSRAGCCPGCLRSAVSTKGSTGTRASKSSASNGTMYSFSCLQLLPLPRMCQHATQPASSSLWLTNQTEFYRLAERCLCQLVVP